jgi:hypothetical protein
MFQALSRDPLEPAVKARHCDTNQRHPELVSGSIGPRDPMARLQSGDGGLRRTSARLAAPWTLKQVQGDEISDGRIGSPS